MPFSAGLSSNAGGTSGWYSSVPVRTNPIGGLGAQEGAKGLGTPTVGFGAKVQNNKKAARWPPSVFLIEVAVSVAPKAPLEPDQPPRVDQVMIGEYGHRAVSFRWVVGRPKPPRLR